VFSVVTKEELVGCTEQGVYGNPEIFQTLDNLDDVHLLLELFLALVQEHHLTSASTETGTDGLDDVLLIELEGLADEHLIVESLSPSSH